jgi:hypothetical protein
MFYVILVTEDFVPTVFGPYCSFPSALMIAEGPVCNVPHGALREEDETYAYPQTGSGFVTCTITTAEKIGCKPS